MAATHHPASPIGAGAKSPSSPLPPSPVRTAAAIQPSSPRYFFSSLATTSSPHRRIAIAVDLSDESAFAVKWAVQNYLRPADVVVLLHVCPTSVLYGAYWGSVPVSLDEEEAAPPVASEGPEEDDPTRKKKREEDFDAFSSAKSLDLAQPLVTAQIPWTPALAAAGPPPAGEPVPARCAHPGAPPTPTSPSPPDPAADMAG